MILLTLAYSVPAMTSPSQSILSDGPTSETLSNAQGQRIHPNALEILAAAALWKSGFDIPTVYSPSSQSQCDHHDTDHRDDETVEEHSKASQAPFSTALYGTTELRNLFSGASREASSGFPTPSLQIVDPRSHRGTEHL